MKRKKQKPKSDEEKYDYMKTNKDNIKNVIKDTETIKKLNELVINTHKIVIHAYNFIKLYCIYLYENNKDIPTLDKEFIMDVFKAITVRLCNSGGYREDNMPKQQKKLMDFYKTHYKETTDKDEILYYDKMSYILAYEAIDMTTNIHVNIQEHFIQHLNKFVNITFDLKSKHKEITNSKLTKEEKKQARNDLNKEFREIKNDLMSFEKKLTAKKEYHKWIKEQRKLIYGKKKSFDNDSIYYDLKSKTHDYIKPMIYIGKELEKTYDKIANEIKEAENKKEKQQAEQIRLFNVLPLRTNIVPKNICLDTPAIIQNLIGESTGDLLKNYKKENKYNEIWSKFFNLNKRVFKKGKDKYQFNFMIRTDAISVCALFIRLNENGKPLTKKNKKCRSEDDTKYIENVEFTDEMKKKRMVCADPNYADLIYCGSKNKDNKLETFRYTQNQRRLETGKKKYMKIIEKENKKVKINNKTIKEVESGLTNYTAKTNNYTKFKEYLKVKNRVNLTLFDHYQKEYFRKFKLNRFINTQKSESKMIDNFKNKFGDKDNVVFVMGDYDKKEHMKSLEPVICKRFRRLFRNAGYPVYLINEFRTSKLCNSCHEEVEPFLERSSHKPRDTKNNKLITVHGLLRHTDDKHTCELIHNRDKNAVQNMLYIIDEIIKTGKRPDKYSRTNSSALHGAV